MGQGLGIRAFAKACDKGKGMGNAAWDKGMGQERCTRQGQAWAKGMGQGHEARAWKGGMEKGHELRGHSNILLYLMGSRLKTCARP